ncbi:hypothetical protein J7E50_10125 [Pedobacter sp. ISL-68]|uniref:hypothetical protein n=1 Tax=unclassified Pedobacter TaxID=2628915 RepID=UPI001BEB1805|nr:MULTISPECIES: hypothetical protein [unclassified Pedobacter]MBT2561187.1 hypothetical protein [Pedobacter sp. ISL-64]MBT2590576.1 hypothetical protein [Pedobacter sp. ISL-68]
MRLYLDSNIYRQIRPGSRHLNIELLNAVESLRAVLLFVFSDAHLDDLSSSEASFREVDLMHMGEYVGNNYFSFDVVKKQDHFYLATPLEAYGSKDYEASRAIMEDPNRFLSEALEMEELKPLKPLFDSLLDLPFFDTFKDVPVIASGAGTGSGGMANPFLEIGSIRDALAGTGQVGGFINSKDEFSRYQSLLRSYVDRADYGFEAWSFDFDQRMKDTYFGKTFSEMVDIVSTGTGPADHYQRFINTYTQLEFLGVTEERSGKKRKKNSYMDIHRDAAHAYFASRTDYFVSDDRGVQQKAFITYRLLGIKTEVLSVRDFIARSPLLLGNEEDLNSLSKGIEFSLEHGFVLHHSLLKQQQVIKLPYPALNYFNRLQVSTSDVGERSLILFRSVREQPGVMYAEFDLLVGKCTRLFGVPVDRKQRLEISQFESKSDEDTQRIWQWGRSMASLNFGDTTDHRKVIYLEILFPSKK